MPSIFDFATWVDLARLLTVGNPRKLLEDGGFVVGAVVGRSSVFTCRVGDGSPAHSRAQTDAVGLVWAALEEVGRGQVAFGIRVTPALEAVFDLFDCGAAMETLSPYPDSMVLVEGAVPEPWRRLPMPVPEVTAAPTADPARLERLLRGRLPGAIGATDAEIATAEARLGVALPDELATLYRVAGGGLEEDGHAEAVRCRLLSIDELTIADAEWQPSSWRYGATEAVRTPPDAAVQGLPGSPGWMVFAGNGGRERFAVDLTPGPAGHLGQIIVLGVRSLGGYVVADSLTDMVEHGSENWRLVDPQEYPAVARINSGAFTSVDEAAHPDLEVLTIGTWDGEPLSLAAVADLPRLRTLRAQAGTLSDPGEIGGLTNLEYLAIGVREWRVLLAADAVPKGLSAAGIDVERDQDPADVAALANELLALWGRPLISRTTIRGSLMPPA
jgi:cell wall assembly regulator SMI1